MIGGRRLLKPEREQAAKVRQGKCGTRWRAPEAVEALLKDKLDETNSRLAIPLIDPLRHER
jgi:hypothetical protein